MSNFRVVSQTGQLSSLNVGSLNAGSGSFSSVDGKLTEGTIVGYTPGVIGNAAVVGLTSTYTNVAAIAATSLTLPAGAVATQVSVKNNDGAVGGSTDFDIGVNAALNGTDASFFDAVPVGSVNYGAVVKTAVAVTGTAASTSAQYITVTANGAASTGKGLKVTVSYVML